MEAGVIVGCLLVSACLSGMEAAVPLLHTARVQQLEERGSIGAGILLEYLRQPGRLASTVTIGRALARAMVLVLVVRWFLPAGGMMAAIGAAVLSGGVLWLAGDLIPKSLFCRFPHRLAARVAVLLRMLQLGLWPLTRLLETLSRAFVAALGGDPATGNLVATRERLRVMADQSSILTGEQRDLVASILDSGSATARDIMQPASKVVTTKAGRAAEARRKISVTSGFSRLPVAGADPAAGRWQGLWVLYDSMFVAGNEPRFPPRIEGGVHVEEILGLLRKARSPMAFIQDHGGQDIGIVTIEDVLRHYLGEVNL